MKRVGIIDLGSNSIKLLVAEAGETGLRALVQQTRETRIGGRFDGGEIPAGTWQAAVEAVRELQDLAREAGAEALRVVGTSALRDASNRRELAEKLRVDTGLTLEVLSGEEEASFIGRGIGTDPHWMGASDYAVMDQGGGSLELVLFSGGKPVHAVSLPLGAVRLFHRYQEGKPGLLGPGVRDACAAACREALEASGFPWAQAAGVPWAGTGGAFTMSRLVGAYAGGIPLEQSDPWLTVGRLREIMEMLSALPMRERIESCGLPPNRADILPMSLIPVLEALGLAGAERILHSFHNLRFGLAAEMLPKKGV